MAGHSALRGSFGSFSPALPCVQSYQNVSAVTLFRTLGRQPSTVDSAALVHKVWCLTLGRHTMRASQTRPGI
jgi:hypothetical protein